MQVRGFRPDERTGVPEPIYFLPSVPRVGLPNPMALLYFIYSDTEHICSLTSKSGGSNFMGNLFIATQGFAYIFGSSMVTVSSNRSRLARWNRSSTRRSSLCGRPPLSSQVLSSVPEVCATNV